MLSERAGGGVQTTDGIGVQLSKPEYAVRVQREIIGRARQAQRLADLAGVSLSNHWQLVDMILPACRRKLPDIIGVLLSKPERAISGNNHAHDARLAFWRGLLPEFSGLGIKRATAI